MSPKTDRFKPESEIFPISMPDVCGAHMACTCDDLRRRPSHNLAYFSMIHPQRGF